VQNLSGVYFLPNQSDYSVGNLFLGEQVHFYVIRFAFRVTPADFLTMKAKLNVSVLHIALIDILNLLLCFLN
jgi:hypothetical protein